MWVWLGLLAVAGAYVSYRVYRASSSRAMMAMKVLTYLLSRKAASDTFSLQVNDTQESVTIAFERNGTKYALSVPYQRRLINRMTNLQVKLKKGDTLVDVTHCPGIPYTLKAQQLGGDNYVVYDLEEGEEVTLEPDEIPLTVAV